ncbi:MAG: transposase [Cyclobacteriaceae bacterium]|nr:transposase [Cyclobacteriaceae bacterium]
MSRKYKIRDQEKLHFVTFTIVQWLDVFIRREYSDIFLDSLRYCQKSKGLEVYAFCIMSSHAHLIIGRNGDNKLEDIIRDIKKYTSVKIIEAIRNNPTESRRDWLLKKFEEAGMNNKHNNRYQFWQQHSHPIELSTNELIEQKLDYVHDNPVNAGIVLSPEHYLYSSAINYAGLPEKLIDVILIE